MAFNEISDGLRWEIALEAADIEISYGSEERSGDLLAELEQMRNRTAWARSQIDATRAEFALRTGDIGHAQQLLDAVDWSEPSSSTAHKARLMAMVAHLLVAKGSSEAKQAIAAAALHARSQGAGLWLSLCQVLDAVAGDAEDLRRYIRLGGRDQLAAMSMAAEVVVPLLGALATSESAIVLNEAARRPERWRAALRREIDKGGSENLAAAVVLDAIGTMEDVPRLRALAKAMRGRPESALGRTLARRVAPRVFVEDQGRVAITVGSRSVDGSSVRRKVLGLLCFLVSRPQFSATRDEVLDALWPDFDPADALNSLNQTVYFLRRIFEPSFQEDLSPGHVNHEADVIWLDQELVETRSRRCWVLIRSLPPEPSAAEVSALADAYRAPFALDFAYEEWATAFRSNLQSSFLQVIEQSLMSDTESGHFERGIILARQALEACPEADNVELSLLRLYKLSGSHAAASEQYAHYSGWVRETLGIEPPTLDSL